MGSFSSTRRLMILGTALACVSGCTFDPDPSSEVGTAEIYAEFKIISSRTGGTIFASASFQRDDPAGVYLELVDGDAATVELASGDILTLEEGSPDTGVDFIDNYVSYTSEVPAQGESPYFFALSRTTGESAPRTTTALPAPFDIDPLAEQVFSRESDAIVVAWSPSGSTDRVEIRAVSLCSDTVLQSDLPDSGSYTVAAGSLTHKEGKETDDCSLTIWIKKARDGLVDPAFRGGEAVGEQERYVELTSTP